MADCPSQHHEVPVKGTVHGMFHNAYNPAMDAPAAYCQDCFNVIGHFTQFFTPSTQDPEGLALVQAIHDRKARR